jgi:hypothetical protein
MKVCVMTIDETRAARAVYMPAMMHRFLLVTAALALVPACAIDGSAKGRQSILDPDTDPYAEEMWLTHDGRTIERRDDDLIYSRWQPRDQWGPPYLYVMGDMQVDYYPDIVDGASMSLRLFTAEDGPTTGHFECDPGDGISPTYLSIRFYSRLWRTHHDTERLESTSCSIDIWEVGPVGGFVEGDFTAHLQRIRGWDEPIDEFTDFTGHFRIERSADNSLAPPQK